MKKTGFSGLGIAIGMLITAPVMALDFGVDAHAGSMGLGVGAALQLTRNVNMRVGLNDYNYEDTIDDEDGLDIEGSLALDNQYAMVDFYPSRNGSFHITAGLYLNDNEFSGTAIVIDDGTLVGESEVLAGTEVSGAVNFDNEAGYLGVGWGNTFSRGLVHFGIDLGVVFQGSPKANLNVTLSPTLETACSIDPLTYGCVSGDDIALEEQQLEDRMSKYDMHPLLQMTIGFSF